MDSNSLNVESPIFCDRCSRELQPGAGDFYVVNIEAVADPTPPTLSDEDCTQDLQREIQRLLEEARQLSEQELLDQVYRRLTLFLCLACFREWIENPAG